MYQIFLVGFLVLAFSSSCTTFNRRFSSVVEQEKWNQAVSFILRYYPEYFSREELLSDKRLTYHLMGEYRLGKETILINGESLPRRFPFPGNLHKSDFIGSDKQVEYEDWNGSDDWGVSLDEKNIYRGFRVKNGEMFNNLNDQLVSAIFNKDKVIKMYDDYYSIPSLQKLPLSYLNKMKCLADNVNAEDMDQCVDIVFNKIPKYEFRLNNNEYFYRHKNHFEDLEKDYCELDIQQVLLSKIIPSRVQLKNYLKFVETLEIHKRDLMDLMNLTNSEYNELAAVAIGTLFVESNFGGSARYLFKEKLRIGSWEIGQSIVRAIKRLKNRADSNSRGLTQIKSLDDWVDGTKYNYLKTANYQEADNAALATMVILREKLGYLKHYMKKEMHPNINKRNWQDYIYYLYVGSGRQITQGKATPDMNKRNRKILFVRRNLMFVENCEVN